MNTILADGTTMLTVYGTPAPQGSKRALRNSHTGRIQLVEASKMVRPWREAVKAAALDARHVCDEAELVPTRRGPVTITMTFTVPKPASAPKRRRTWPAKKPDLDKLARSTLDALVDAGVIHDDAQVITLNLSKTYPLEAAGALDTPGARITIELVEE